MAKTLMPELKRAQSYHKIKLTNRQQAFVREFMVDGNRTQAAIRAGFSPRTAQIYGSQLYAKPAIQAAIQELQRQRAVKTTVTADRVLAELGRLALWNVKDLFDADGRPKDLADIPDDLAACIRKVTFKETKRGITYHYEMVDKLAAINDLAKHFGLFAPLQVNVQHDYSGLSDGQLANEIKQLREKLGDIVEQVPGDDGVLIDVTPEVATSHGADTCTPSEPNDGQDADNTGENKNVPPDA